MCTSFPMKRCSNHHFKLLSAYNVNISFDISIRTLLYVTLYCQNAVSQYIKYQREENIRWAMWLIFMSILEIKNYLNVAHKIQMILHQSINPRLLFVLASVNAFCSFSVRYYSSYAIQCSDAEGKRLYLQLLT